MENAVIKTVNAAIDQMRLLFNKLGFIEGLLMILSLVLFPLNSTRLIFPKHHSTFSELLTSSKFKNAP